MEEEILLANEMEWATLFFHHQAVIWKCRTERGVEGAGVGEAMSEGQMCYALKQESMWRKFATMAEDEFSKAKGQ